LARILVARRLSFRIPARRARGSRHTVTEARDGPSDPNPDRQPFDLVRTDQRMPHAGRPRRTRRATLADAFRTGRRPTAFGTSRTRVEPSPRPRRTTDQALEAPAGPARRSWTGPFRRSSTRTTASDAIAPWRSSRWPTAWHRRRGVLVRVNPGPQGLSARRIHSARTAPRAVRGRQRRRAWPESRERALGHERGAFTGASRAVGPREANGGRF